MAVKLFAARYGYPEPPNEDFHVYLLDQNRKVLEQISVPYGKIERGGLRWYTFEFPAIEVPEKFFVAVWFNAERTKGVYLGMDKKVPETHSYIGLPDKGFKKVDAVLRLDDPGGCDARERQEAHSSESDHLRGGEGRRHGEHRGDCRSRTWNDATGAFSVEAAVRRRRGRQGHPQESRRQDRRHPLGAALQRRPGFRGRTNGGKSSNGRSRAAGQSRELSHDNGRRPASRASPAAATPCASRSTATRGTSRR